MAVYVDPMLACIQNRNWRWNRSCHMFSDDIDELHAFAKRIGLRREWFQNGGRLPHYDLNERRRDAAVKAGVVQLTRTEAVEFWRRHWPRVKPERAERSEP